MPDVLSDCSTFDGGANYSVVLPRPVLLHKTISVIFTNECLTYSQIALPLTVVMIHWLTPLVVDDQYTASSV